MKVHLDYRMLEAFVATMDTGSLVAAAQRTNATYSTTSRRMVELEHILRLQLFKRSQRGMTPTENASDLLPRAITTLQEMDRFVDDAHRLCGAGTSRQLKVVSFPRCAAALVVPAIADFLRAQPKAKVSIDAPHRQHLIDTRNLSGYHLAVTTELTGAHPIGRVIGQVPLVVVTSKGHELASLPSVEVGDLDGYAMVQLTHDTLMRNVTDEILDMAGIRPTVQGETSSSLHGIDMAAAGIGFFIVDALIPESARSEHVAVIPLRTSFSVDVRVITNGCQAKMKQTENLLYCLTNKINSINALLDRQT